ncbi:MAG: alpha-hydroxy acid oxidase [Acidimicrobiales bacterium]|nr:alpha-hydroxy acid oxidase [Actinomycetota bacterium]
MSVFADLFAQADARAAERLHSVHDARRVARRRLPAVVFDYIDGAADDELTMRRNEAAFAGVTFRQKAAVGRIVPSLRTSVVGREIDLPILLAPCGLVRLMHADGAAGVARAAASRGTVSVLSTVAGSPVEVVAPASSTPLWFQVYAAGGLPEADALCDRAAAVGVEALVVTVDTPALGNRERDVRHGVSPPLRVDARNAAPLGAQVLMRPRWAAQLAATGVRLSRRGAGPPGHGNGLLSSVASPFSWEDVAHLRKRWAGPLLVKGLLSGEDARRAVDAGASGVVVSNHGGRQLDGAPATLDALPDVVAAVGSYADVLVDGGIRRGAHVVAALAMGARAVLVGRPYLFGLAAAGERGVERILDILDAEMRRTMTLMGCPAVTDLGPEWLAAPVH